MNNIVIQDTMEAYLKSGDGSKHYYFGLTSKADISQKIKQEMLKAGIGNGTVAVLQSDKELTLKISNVLHSDDVYEIQSGAEMTNGVSIPVHKQEQVELTGGKLTLSDLTASGKAIVISPNGKQETLDVVLGVMTITDGKEGDTYKVVYSSTVANANVLSIDSKKFPKNFEVELHTIAYDTVENVVVADIYWMFNRALPDGNINASYEAGKNSGDEINLTVLTPLNGTEMGKYVIVPRA